MTTVYVVLKVLEEGDVPCPRSEMQGIFTDEAEAERYCLGHWDYMLGPVVLNAPLADETTPWIGARYPEAERYFRENPGAHPSSEA